MKYFTESPFEKMMMQKPSTRPRAREAAGRAGCEGCGYGEKRPCIAVCMRKLTGSGEKTVQAARGMDMEKGEANEVSHL